MLGVGTPYHEEKRYEADALKLRGSDDVDRALRVKLKLELPRANLSVATGDGYSIVAEAEGFGSPGSRLEDRFKPTYDAERRELGLSLRQSKSGFFATVEQPMTVTMPLGRFVDADVILESGLLVLDLSDADFATSDFGAGAFWDLDLGRVDLTLLVPKDLDLKIELGDGVEAEAQNEAGLDWDGAKKRWKRGENPDVKVRVKRFEGGDFIIRETPAQAE